MNKKEDFYNCLIEAGCSIQKAAECLSFLEKKQVKSAIKCLESCRQNMLENLHFFEHKIECLDYLVYTLEKENGTNFDESNGGK